MKNIYNLKLINKGPVGTMCSCSGQMERWIDGQMDRQTDGQTDRWTDRWMDGRTCGQMDGCADGWMDGRTDGWMEGWMERWIIQMDLENGESIRRDRDLTILVKNQ